MCVPSVALLSSLWLCFVPTLSAPADVLISIHKASQRMSVSVNGQQRHAWPVSSGAAGYDTPSGSFRPLRMERTHFSKEWDNAPMPHSIFFTSNGHAIHGTNHARQLGRPGTAASVWPPGTPRPFSHWSERKGSRTRRSWWRGGRRRGRPRRVGRGCEPACRTSTSGTRPVQMASGEISFIKLDSHTVSPQHQGRRRWGGLARTCCRGRSAWIGSGFAFSSNSSGSRP